MSSVLCRTAAAAGAARKKPRRTGVVTVVVAAVLLSYGCARTFVNIGGACRRVFLQASGPTNDQRLSLVQRYAEEAPTATAEVETVQEEAKEEATAVEEAPKEEAVEAAPEPEKPKFTPKGPEPELKSDMNIDYSKFRDLLAAMDFKGADAESRRLLIEMAGPQAVKRGWVYFSEVKNIPVNDLQTLDNLWRHFSNDKFGFQVQRKIWRQSKGVWAKFALAVSWFTDPFTNRNWPDEFVYSLDAPAGHLPLTNAIRGAQVMQELMVHPAFDKKKK